MKSSGILEKSLIGGRTIITAEIMPPKTPSPEIIKKKAAAFQGWITAANLTDNQSAVVRMSSLACSMIVRECGIEPIMQITCRDRNRLAIQSDVIGAAGLGIHNILCVTGDHQKFGNHPESRNVFDIDSIQLIQMLKRMRDDGVFLNEEPIQNTKKTPIVPPSIFIGAAANPFGHPRAFRPYRLLKKINAGADFIQTQPVFDYLLFREWQLKIVDLGIPTRAGIIVGVTPVKSSKALIYMRDNVPGIHIPQEMITRMESASDPEREGFEIAKELIIQIMQLPGIHGFHIMAIGWEAIVPNLVSDLDLKPNLNFELEK